MADLTIRASSWSTLLDCPARWAAIHLDGATMPSSGAAVLGTAIHQSTGVYDLSQMNGSGLTVDECAQVVVDHIKDPGEDVAWGDGWTPKEAEKRGLLLHTKYCREVSPGYQWIAVEAALPAMEVKVDGLVIEMTGHVDNIFETQDGARGVLDKKSGARIAAADGVVRTHLFRPQLASYELLASQKYGAMTAPAQILALPTKLQRPKISVGEIPAAVDQMVAEGGYLSTLAMYAKAGVYPGNPSSILCSKKFCVAYEHCKWRG